MNPSLFILSLLFLLAFSLPATTAYTLHYKAKKLASLPTHSNVLTLDSSSFNVLTESPRNYSLVVLITALDPKLGCSLCHQFQPEFHRAAYSWLAHRGKKHPLYFAALDFANGQAVFQSLKLTTAPNVYFYPATHGNFSLPSPPNNAQFIEYELARRGLEDVHLIEWIGRQINETFKSSLPPDYTKYAVFAVAGFVIIIARQHIIRLAQLALLNRKLYALAALASTLLLTNGYMWNTIRHPPYVAADRSGNVQYILAGMQQQYGIETQLSALLHGAAAFSVVGLTISVPKIKSIWLQRLTTAILLVLMVGSYAIIMRMFDTKSPGYLGRLL